MSHWTYVTGVIRADTMARSTIESEFLARTVLAHLPKITGSENDAKCYLAVEDGHNASSTTDEFGQDSNLGTEFVSFGKRPLFEAQTQVIVTIHGALRDRRFEQTMRETVKFLSRLSNRLCVDECLLSVSGCDMAGRHRHEIIDSPEWLGANCDMDWTRKLTWAWDEDGRGPHDPDYGKPGENNGKTQERGDGDA